jgi:hypothetical protein
MLKKIPFADPSPDPELDESKPSVVAGARPTTIQGPADCVWPFTEADSTAGSKRKRFGRRDEFRPLPPLSFA